MTDDINAKMPASLKEALEILKKSTLPKTSRPKPGLRNLARFVDSHVHPNEEMTENVHQDEKPEPTSRTVINFKRKASLLKPVQVETGFMSSEANDLSGPLGDVDMTHFPVISLAASSSVEGENVTSTSMSICINGQDTAVFRLGDRVLIHGGVGVQLGEELTIADFSFPLSSSEIGASYVEVQGLRLEQLKRLITRFGRPAENKIDART